MENQPDLKQYQTIAKDLAQNNPKIVLVYLFGSAAADRRGPLSDYDFAFYLDEQNAAKRFDLRLKIITALTQKLKTNKIDAVILNDIKSPLLKFNIIKNGKLVYSKTPHKIIVEPKILSEFFDFRESLSRYGLMN